MITTSKQTKYKTFHTICFLDTYLQANTATIQIMIAVATPCKATTILRLTPTKDKTIETRYKTATAMIVYKENLLIVNPLLFVLDDFVDFFLP